MKRMQLAIAGFEDGGQPWAKECGQPLETGKGKETFSFLKPPKRKVALPTPGFQPIETPPDVWPTEL